MSLLTALVFGTMFGAGVSLLVRRDAIRMVGGGLLVGNAVVLLLLSAGFDGTEAPLLPIAAARDVADPLVQALALTTLVINFGVTVLLLRVTLAVERTHDTLDMEDLVRAEVADEPEEGRGKGPDR